MPTNTNRAIIAGAGISGAVAAYLLAENGYKVTIYEQRKTICGNVYDYKDSNGIIVQEYGPHIFHTNSKEVFDFLSKFTQWTEYQHRVRGLIDGKIVPIPFNLTAIDELYPKDMAEYIKKVLMKEIGLNRKVPIMTLRNNKDPLIRDFADYVYNKVFYHYTCKQWGLTPEQLDPSIMQRVPVYVSHEDRYFLDTYQYMPTDGFTSLFAKMLDHPNIEIILNTSISKVISFNDNNEIIYQGQPFTGPVIYTGCIDELFNNQFGKLPYRTLDFKFETLDTPSYQPVAVVNYSCTEDFTRITEFTKFTCKTQDKTVIVKEYPRQHEKNDIPYYPIEIEANLKKYDEYKNFYSKYKNFFPLGRLANYKYINMDIAVLNAMLLAKKIIKEN